ncbi:hypothetical protein HGP17_32285 [Rhizobium sp. P38BS-XIX]|uniref:hypothetical protein n=1 Tax=Rhizobium sp. P38BS-XIX TaxID=2726740 RepID=UPI001456DDA3|nr:hypothetical protein [Rhizobium sp. P38BS-XIX]NLS01537.1 hypothetical protein [Rhizobium sp. P38BS-XIX]
MANRSDSCFQIEKLKVDRPWFTGSFLSVADDKISDPQPRASASSPALQNLNTGTWDAFVSAVYQEEMKCLVSSPRQYCYYFSAHYVGIKNGRIEHN